MKRIRFTQKVLVLAFMSLLSFSAYAYRPTYTYSATVQAGLSTSSTGGGLVYVDEEATGYITVSNDKWRPNASEDGSQGGNSSNTQNAMVDVYLYAKANRGYQFDGWAASDTGTPGNKGELVNGVYRSVQEFQVGNYYTYPYRNKEYTIYAFFSPIEYYITYDANGGSVSPSTPQKYTIRSTDALRIPTKTGYTFNGWKVTYVDEADGGWTLDGNAPSVLNKNIGNVTLQAQWSLVNYEISFSGNGGTGTGPSNIPYTIESSGKTLPACPYSRDGYLFIGWKPSSNAGNWTTSEIYSAGATVPTGKYGNVTLAAQWEELTDIIISVSGLNDSESAIFTVSRNDSVIFTVAISAASPSVTIKNQVVGEYTVTPQSWSWTYSISPSYITKTISSTDHTFAFTASKASGVKKHAEASAVNWHPTATP